MFTTLDKKEKTILASAGVLILLMILYKYWKGKSQESGYVEPRGFFQNNATAVMPTPAPAPAPPPTPTTPPTIPPAIGREIGHPYPLPYPLPYPYPAGYNYGTIPYVVVEQPAVSNVAKSECYKNVKINGEETPTCFSTKQDYTKFLKQSYNTLVDSYNDALYSFGWGRAVKIAKAMRKVRRDIDAEMGII
jgi:hypothetical protein